MEETNAALLKDKIWPESDLAKLLGINETSLLNLRMNRGLPFVQVGRGRRVYLASSIERWLAGQEKTLKTAE